MGQEEKQLSTINSQMMEPYSPRQRADNFHIGGLREKGRAMRCEGFSAWDQKQEELGRRETSRHGGGREGREGQGEDARKRCRGSLQPGVSTLPDHRPLPCRCFQKRKGSFSNGVLYAETCGDCWKPLPCGSPLTGECHRLPARPLRGCGLPLSPGRSFQAGTGRHPLKQQRELWGHPGVLPHGSSRSHSETARSLHLADEHSHKEAKPALRSPTEVRLPQGERSSGPKEKYYLAAKLKFIQQGSQTR